MDNSSFTLIAFATSVILLLVAFGVMDQKTMKLCEMSHSRDVCIDTLN